MARRSGTARTADMHIALNMAKSPKEGFCAPQWRKRNSRSKKLCAEVREEKKRGVEFPGHRMVMALIESHSAIVCENHTDGCLPCQDGTQKNPQTHWRRIGTYAPPPDRPRQATPEPIPTPPRTASVPPSDIAAALGSQMDCVPAGYAYLHAPLPNAQIFSLDAYARDSNHNEDCIPDLRTDKGTSTG